MKKPTNLRWKVPLFLLCGGVLVLCAFLGCPCPIREAIGVPCPGCGMSRAWLAALRFDFAEAFYYHPLFWVVPVVAIFLLYDCQPFSSKRMNTAILCTILGLLFICYIGRLYAFFNGNLTI